MKKILLALAAVVAVAFAGMAQTPIYWPVTLGSFLSTGSTATNIAYVIDARKQDKVALSWDQYGSGATAQTVGIGFQRSVDGVNYEPVQYLTIAGPGNAQVVTVTNIPTWGAGYIKLAFATNANAGSVYTTNTLKYAVKIEAP